MYVRRGFNSVTQLVSFSTELTGWKQFAHQKTGMYYNGLSHEQATKSITNGTHSM